MTERLTQFTALVESISQHQPLQSIHDEARGMKLKAATPVESDKWRSIQAVANALMDYRDSLEEERVQREASGDSFE